MFSSFLFMQRFSFTPIFLLFLCYLERDFLFFVVRCVFLRTFLAVLAFQSLNMFIFFVLCEAGDRLLKLARKIQKLEQGKSLETTEGTLASLRRCLNRPNSAFDRFEVLDFLQALVRLARTQAHQKAKEYAAALDEVRARWDSLNSSELQRVGSLGGSGQSKDREEGRFNLEVCDQSVQDLGPRRAVDRVTDVVVGGVTSALVDFSRRRSRTVEVVELLMEVGVEILANLTVCGLG